MSNGTAKTVKIDVDVQYASTQNELPKAEDIATWVTCALREHTAPASLTVRIVDEAEGSELNERWRGGAGATNVLSFASDGLDEIAPELLGDVVVCAPVVAREAGAQAKLLRAHWAHMVVHGTLHLLGYDHEDSSDAEQMESLEVAILVKLGFADPYTPVTAA